MKQFLSKRKGEIFLLGSLGVMLLQHVRLWRSIKPQETSEAVDLWSVTDLSQLPKMSMLVAAWNEQPHIEAFIEAFQKLTYPHLELVLCAGGTDKTFELARQSAGASIKVVEQLPGEGKQTALHKIFPLTSGELIYLTDIDCRPTNEVMLALLQPILKEKLEAATGTIRPLPEQEDNPLVRVLWSIERFNAFNSGGVTNGLHGANVVLTRKALEATGSFAQAAPSGTDYTLAHELTGRGYTIAYVGASEMPTKYPPMLKIYIKKQSRWLRNVVVLGSHYGAWQEVRSVALTLAIPFVVFGLLLLGLKQRIFVGFSLLLILQAILNRFRFAYSVGFKVKLSGVVASVVGDLLAGMLATSQILRKKTNWS